MRRASALALSALLVGGLAACGDDGEESQDEAGEEAEETETTDGSEGTTDDGGDGGDGSGDIDLDLDDIDLGALSEECRVITEASMAVANVFFGAEDEADVDFGTIAEAMAAFADEAPDEIAEDVALVAEAFSRFAEELGEIDLADPDALLDPEVAARMAEAAEVLDSEEFNEANERITAYVDEHCGDVDPTE